MILIAITWIYALKMWTLLPRTASIKILLLRISMFSLISTPSASHLHTAHIIFKFTHLQLFKTVFFGLALMEGILEQSTSIFGSGPFFCHCLPSLIWLHCTLWYLFRYSIVCSQQIQFLKLRFHFSFISVTFIFSWTIAPFEASTLMFCAYSNFFSAFTTTSICFIARSAVLFQPPWVY